VLLAARGVLEALAEPQLLALNRAAPVGELTQVQQRLAQPGNAKSLFSLRDFGERYYELRNGAEWRDCECR
jgi:hypothetical protein